MSNIDIDVLFELWSPSNEKIRPLATAFNLAMYPTLDGHGTASFSLLRNDPAVKFLQKDCIVHVFFNGRDVFQWIIDSDTASFAEGSGHIITYSGQGIRSFLDRALIYPTGWPPLQGDPRLPQYGANILTNPGFEQVTTGVLAPYWTVIPVGNVSYSTDTGNGSEKNEKGEIIGRSFRAVSASQAVNAMVAKQVGFFNSAQNLPIDKPSTWRCTAAVRANNITGVDYGASIVLRWYNNEGVELGSHSDKITQANNWNRLEFDVTIAPAATQFQLELYVRGQAIFDFDLLSLQVMYLDALPIYPIQPDESIAIGENLVQGNDFEWARGITYVPAGQMGWYFDNKVPILRRAYQMKEQTTPPPYGWIMTVQRNNPAVEGRVCYYDLPVQQSKTYIGSFWCTAGSLYNANLGLGMYGPRTWAKRVWLDAAKVAISDSIATIADVRLASYHTKVDLSPITAPVGAQFLRIELYAPAGYGTTADINFEGYFNPSWTQLDIREGTSIEEQEPAGVWRAFQRKRLPDIIRAIVTETNNRLGSNWPVTVGTVEYDEDYDVIDGVLVPKDERTAIFRFDHVGQALISLTTGSGDLVMQNMTLHYYKQYGKDLAHKVTFREAVDVVNVPENTSSSRDIKTKLIVEGQGEGSNTVTVEVEDTILRGKYGVREGFLDRKGVAHLIDLKKEGIQAFKEMTRSERALTITVSTHKYVPFTHYNLGDVISVDVPEQQINGQFRIRAIRPVIGATVTAVDLDLDSVNYDIFVKILQQQAAQGNSISVGQRMPQGQVTLYQVNDHGDVDATHPWTFRFFVPNQPLFANQIQLAFQGIAYRTSLKINQLAITTGESGATLERNVISRQNTGTNTVVTSETGTETAETYNAIGTSTESTLSDNITPHSHISYLNPTRLVKHTHTVTAVPHTHTITIPAVPAHTHSVPLQIQYGIFEEGSPTGVSVTLNGVRLDPNVYKYTDEGGQDIEVGRYVKKGWNTVKFDSTTLGRIVAQVVIQAYINTEV